MEVEDKSFHSNLLAILEAVAESDFVAFDLEFSGFVARQSKGFNARQTLQERYAEIKKAAEKYTVLQIGLTCAEHDERKSKYFLKTFNFNLNPCVQEKSLEVERVITFHSDTIDFLRSHGFRIGLPFESGVQYLSRNEEKWANQHGLDRLDKSKYANMVISEDNRPARQFIANLRHEMDQWLMHRTPYPHYLNIYSSRKMPEHDEEDLPEMNNFERKLVHQIIRSEYPGFATKSLPRQVQITDRDETREELDRKRRHYQLVEQTVLQRGFRWVVEALVGSDISNLDVRMCAKDLTGASISISLQQFQSRLVRIVSLLKKKRTVLVGHNLFMDLVYFYQCFIDDLPDTVEEFQREIRQLFPLVVDTKYLKTYDCPDNSKNSSLQDIAEELRLQRLPRVGMRPGYDKYLNTEASHEAGYDSYLTAKVMIKLSTKIKVEAGGVYDFSKDGLETRETSTSPTAVTAWEQQSSSVSSPAFTAREMPSSPSSADSALDRGFDAEIADSGSRTEAWIDPNYSPEPLSKKKRRKQKKQKKKTASSRFSSPNPYDLLGSAVDMDDGEDLIQLHDADEDLIQLDDDDDDDLIELDADEPSAGNGSLAQNQHAATAGALPVLPQLGKKAPPAHIRNVVPFVTGGTPLTMNTRPGGPPTADRSRHGNNAHGVDVEPPSPPSPWAQMPSFGNRAFWNTFGNKLRVFGTQELLCDLAPREHSDNASGEDDLTRLHW